ncbi:hypothetical protein CRUP_000256, partial [Coryphaenoides rupestris]
MGTRRRRRRKEEGGGRKEGGGGRAPDPPCRAARPSESRCCAASERRCCVLTWEQLRRLDSILGDAVVRERLEERGVAVRSVKLNGSAASHALHQDSGLGYKDLDLIFAVSLQDEQTFGLVRDVVLDCLLDFLPAGVCKERISPITLKEAYVQKLVKSGCAPSESRCCAASERRCCVLTWEQLRRLDSILGDAVVRERLEERGVAVRSVRNDTDRWSLISLSNNTGKNVELKFVDSLRRQFEFSVDSFQICLDSLLLFDRCSETPMSEAFHPTVVGESVYGDFEEAMSHLCHRTIATRSPEEIRGGGLLKYCHLLARGFRAASETDMKQMQRYMCSRFFIDFPDIGEQRRKLESYLQNHFVGLEHKRYECLMRLHGVVDESTVCLMGHERRQTLHLISMLALRALAEHNAIPSGRNVTCFYQPAAYVQDINFSNYYIAHVQPPCGSSYQTWLP